MCVAVEVYGLNRLHPVGEARYGLRSTPRCAHGFVATRRNSSLFLARCASPCAAQDVQVPRSAWMRESGHPTCRTPQAVQLPFLGSMKCGPSRAHGARYMLILGATIQLY